MDANEEFVRKHWGNVEIHRRGSTLNNEPVWAFFTTNDLYVKILARVSQKELWDEAAKFTRERLKQIANVEQEIYAVETELKATRTLDWKVPWVKAKVATWSRVMAREQAALDELRSGMLQA
jgi:hypothetical protein